MANSMHFDHIDFDTITATEHGFIDYVNTEFYKPGVIQQSVATIAMWRGEAALPSDTKAH